MDTHIDGALEWWIFEIRIKFLFCLRILKFDFLEKKNWIKYDLFIKSWIKYDLFLKKVESELYFIVKISYQNTPWVEKQREREG
jgi:hypothetical protein